MLLIVDSSQIGAGNADKVKALVAEMVEFVETNEDRPLAYNVYVDEAETTMTVAQIHPDSESMELHMQIAAPVFAKFQSLITLLRMDVYGRPNESLLDQLRSKARMLGNANLVVHELVDGFTRSAAANRSTSPGAQPQP